MTGLIKRCHACGHDNASGAFLCTKCGADISHLVSVPPAKETHDDSTPLLPSATGGNDAPGPAAANGESACPECGGTNPPAALACLHCGHDLSAQAGTARDSQLVLKVANREYPVKAGDIIGRQGNVAHELVSQVRTVSRRHVEIRHDKGCWQLVVLDGVPNTTQLDGRELPRGKPVPITGRHTLQLSTKLSFECEVRLG